ncbi:carbon starvation induced protein CsiD, partial [Salmonella enterica subsp. enterica serovar Muenster]|nr:carbon starvation induced protein CsiD [Salmonella enterica subsp. enterica serovar Muenster]
ILDDLCGNQLQPLLIKTLLNRAQGALLISAEGIDDVAQAEEMGDLAQDQSAAAYQHFAEGIASFRAPCVWLPGNHDFQPAMYSA